MGKPIETLLWLGTAGVLYLTANHIVKNVANDVIRDLTRGDVFRDLGRKEKKKIIWLIDVSSCLSLSTIENQKKWRI